MQAIGSFKSNQVPTIETEMVSSTPSQQDVLNSATLTHKPTMEDDRNLLEQVTLSTTQGNYGDALRMYLVYVTRGNPTLNSFKSIFLNGERAMWESLLAECLNGQVSEEISAAAHWVWGMLYVNDGGEDGKPDYAKALKHLEQAVALGATAALNDLGYMYLHGLGVEKNVKEALEYFEKAAAAGNAAALTNLGHMFQIGGEVERDTGKALAYYEAAAATGNSQAMFQLGCMYKTGQGVGMDLAMAQQYFKNAAKEGNTTAMNMLGFMYQKGYDVKKNYAKAIKYFEQAARAGHTRAMVSLGSLHKKGRGVEQDYEIAAKYYKKAAEAGDVRAKQKIDRLMQGVWAWPDV